MIEGPYELVRDSHDFASAIVGRDGWVVLHLVPGSRRNEQYADEVVELLNRQSRDA
jgi:hypothetical protein